MRSVALEPGKLREGDLIHFTVGSKGLHLVVLEDRGAENNVWTLVVREDVENATRKLLWIEVERP